MKKIKTALISGLLLCVSLSYAQDLPKPSPSANYEQRVGLTDITLKYARPGVKDRVIWGDLVPYDEMWRTGANKATSVTFSDEVKINGKAVPAGEYSIFTIPTAADWTVILNKNTELWGTSGYKEEEDVLRLTVKPMAAPMRERMSITVENMTANSGEVVLHWEKLAVGLFTFEVDVDAKALANIEKAIAEAKPDEWRVYTNAADYCIDNNIHLDKGLAWIDKGLAIKDYWWSRWVKADLLALNGNYKEAIANAEKAITMGKEHYKAQEKEFKYEKRLNEDIEGWKAKM